MNLELFFREQTQLRAFARKDSPYLDVSTIFRNDEGRRNRCIHDKITIPHLEQWLSNAWARPIDTNSDTPILQVVWIWHDPVEKIDFISDSALTQVVKAFGLEGLQEHCATAISGAERVSSGVANASSNVFRFCFRKYPKLMLLWSVDSTTKRVSGICFAGKDKVPKLQSILSMQWQNVTMLLPLACAAVLSSEIDQTHESSKHDVRATEARTGYHRWASRTEDPATDDLGSLLAKMSGLASKMAAAARKGKVIDELLRFIDEQTLFLSQQLNVTSEHITEHIYRSDVAYLQRRIAMHQIETDFLQQRIDIQVSALLGLIAQYDALASHKTAHESKIIAMASQQDSSSMKTLAAVTILYLPSQVIASIFAMPFFNWSAGQQSQTNADSDTPGSLVAADSPVVSSRFAVYWAVTIPLTVGTFAIAGLWLLFEKRHRWKKTTQMQGNSGPYSEEQRTEVKALVRSRSAGVFPIKNSEGDAIHR